MKASLWIVIIIVVAFLGFMMGYALPPFLEVGFGGGGKIEGGAPSEQDLMKQYEQLYQEDTGSTSE
jgi:hypothetical protein